MNHLIRRIGCGAVLTLLGSGCSSPLDGPARAQSGEPTLAYLGMPLPSQPEVSQGPEAAELPHLSEDASLRACLTYAAWSSPTLEAAFHRWRAALARVPQVSSLPDPKLTYGYFIESIQTRTGPMEQQLALSQSFPWWGLLDAQADAATHAAASRWHEYEHARLELFSRVTQAWTAAVDLEREIELTQASLQLLAESESIARTAYEADRMPHDTLLRLQVELGKLEDRIARLHSMDQPRRAALNAAIGRPPHAPLLLPATMLTPTLDITIEEARAALEQNHPKLKAIDATITQHQSAAKAAQLAGLPRWTIGVTGTMVGDALDPTTPQSGADPLLATVGLTLPIWRDKYEGAELEAHARRLEAAANRAAQLDSMHAELTEAVFQYEESIARIERYTKALLPRAEDAVAVSIQALASGTGSATDVLDAVRTLLELQRTLDKSRAEAVNSEARVARLVGGSPEISP